MLNCKSARKPSQLKSYFSLWIGNHYESLRFWIYYTEQNVQKKIAVIKVDTRFCEQIVLFEEGFETTAKLWRALFNVCVATS